MYTQHELDSRPPPLPSHINITKMNYIGKKIGDREETNTHARMHASTHAGRQAGRQAGRHARTHIHTIPN